MASAATRAPASARDLGERVDVVRAVVPAAVDEEGRCPRDAAQVGAVDVARHSRRDSVVAQVVSEPVGVEAQLIGVSHEVAGPQLVLVLEQEVVHLPEPPLQVRGLRAFGGELRVGMDVVQRQVAPHVANVPAVGQELADHGLRAAAVGAFEVPVLEQRDRSVLRSADVVDLGVHRHREIDDRLRRPEDGAQSQLLREHQRDPVDRSRSPGSPQARRRRSRSSPPPGPGRRRPGTRSAARS